MALITYLLPFLFFAVLEFIIKMTEKHQTLIPRVLSFVIGCSFLAGTIYLGYRAFPASEGGGFFLALLFFGIFLLRIGILLFGGSFGKRGNSNQADQNG